MTKGRARRSTGGGIVAPKDLECVIQSVDQLPLRWDYFSWWKHLAQSTNRSNRTILSVFFPSVITSMMIQYVDHISLLCDSISCYLTTELPKLCLWWWHRWFCGEASFTYLDFLTHTRHFRSLRIVAHFDKEEEPQGCMLLVKSRASQNTPAACRIWFVKSSGTSNTIKIAVGKYSQYLRPLEQDFLVAREDMLTTVGLKQQHMWFASLPDLMSFLCAITKTP